MNQKNKLLLSLASGSLLTLAFNVPFLWFLGFVALVPLLVVLKNVSKPREALFYGFFTSFLYMGGVMSFLFSAHPAEWAGIENTVVSFIAISLVWLTTAFALSVGISTWSVVARKWNNSLSSILLLSSTWVFAEALSATMFSIVHAGKETLIGAHWTFGFIGYILAEAPLLLSLASVGGIFLLSFIVVFVNFVVARIFLEKQIPRVAITVLICAFIIGAVIYVHEPQTTGTKRIAALFTTFGPAFLQSENERELQFKAVDAQIRRIGASDEHFDIIIFPENTSYFPVLPETGVEYRLDSLSQNGEVTIIDSMRTRENGPDESQLLFINSSSERVERYTKKLLVPQGEHLSYASNFLGRLLLGKSWNETFKDRRSLLVGEEVVLGYAGETPIGAFFCSEVMTPKLYREAAAQGAELLINAASHSVFGYSPHLHQQILKYSKVRAVENGRYYIQSGNIAPSFVISNRGEVVGETEHNENTVLRTSVPTYNHSTPFTRLGTVGTLTTILVIATTSFVAQRKRNNQ